MTERYRIWKDEKNLEMQIAKQDCIELEEIIVTLLDDAENYSLEESVRSEARSDMEILRKERNRLMAKISEFGSDAQNITVLR